MNFILLGGGGRPVHQTIRLIEDQMGSLFFIYNVFCSVIHFLLSSLYQDN